MLPVGAKSDVVKGRGAVNMSNEREKEPSAGWMRIAAGAKVPVIIERRWRFRAFDDVDDL
jgi:hypothetical protein